jgi:hypothetical protein
MKRTLQRIQTAAPALPPIPEESFDYERVWRTARANLREMIDRLAEFLTQHLDVPLYMRKKLGLFAWRRPAPSTDDWTRYQLYFFGLGLYNTFSYRISISASDRDFLPKNLYHQTQKQLPDNIELSFVAADLEQVKSPDLVKFVESIFDAGLEVAHPWPLFASDQNFPSYAWSVAGEAEHQRRRKGTQMRRERCLHA